MNLLETHQGQFEILLIVAFAMLLGGAIGFERELQGKPAGLRTHMLVAGTAALFVALGTIILEDFSQQLDEQMLQSDPIRLLEAIVTGISFLGAGTIMRDRSKNRIEGLTTAASLLFSASIGATIAVHQYILALGVVVLVLLTLHVLGIVETRLQLHKATENKD